MTPGRPFEFLHATRRLIHGPGCLDRLADLAHEAGCRRALVILDGVFAGGPLQERIAALLAGQELAVHAVPRHEPTQDTVLAGAGAITAAEPDLVVAIGGGSALDTAKGCNFVLTNGGTMADYAGIGKAKRPLRPFIAVPTTHGTGSETQSFALISDARTHRMTDVFALLAGGADLEAARSELTAIADRTMRPRREPGKPRWGRLARVARVRRPDRLFCGLRWRYSW